MDGKARPIVKRIFAFYLVLIMTSIILYGSQFNVAEATEISGETPTDIMGLNSIEETMQKQKEVDEELLNILKSREYSFVSPYVQLDPYGVSPLTAIALFETDTPTRISVYVQGDTPNADVDFTFDEYNTSHAIPILGLYPDRINTVVLTATDSNGSQNKTVIKITTERLPDCLTIKYLITKTMDETAYASGLNFPIDCWIPQPSYPFAFDCNGVIRWYIKNYTNNMEFNFIRDTTEGFILGKGNLLGDTTFHVVNVLGKVLDYYYSAYGSHHSLYQTDHGSWIITGSNPGGVETKEDVLYELSLSDGTILNVLDFKTVLERTRTYVSLGDNYDWMHMNSVVEYQGDVIVSSNFQSLIHRIAWDGQIKWMLTDPGDYLQMYSQYMLQPIGDDFEWPYNQHAIEILPDQDANPDTVDLLLFDNGSSRSKINKNIDDNYSRLVQYRVDEKNMTVEQIWSYGKDHLELFAMWRGDANLLSNGNILGTFSVQSADLTTSSHGVYVEVNRAGELVWECLAQSLLNNPQYWPYSCERMNIYTQNITDLHLGDEPEVFIPDVIWEKYGFSPPSTAISNASPEPFVSDSVWLISVKNAKLLDTFHTETQFLQYDGSYLATTFDHSPATGMQFALFDLEVVKQQTAMSSFDWANLTLVLADGSAYTRAEDIYLSDHGYKRISGAKLSLGSASGYACFEIPNTMNLDEAVFKYTEDDGTVLFNIP